MQSVRTSVIPLLALAGTAVGEEANPLGKVLELVGELQGKISKDGAAEEKAYQEYFEWCDETSKNTDFAKKTAEEDKEALEAKITELASDIDVSSSKIDRLAAIIASSKDELKKATIIRKKEAATFAASEKELAEAVDALGRAVGVLEKEMAKNPAALTQVDTSSSAGMLQGLAVVMEAAAFTAEDQQQLTALIQGQQESDSDLDEAGAPAAAAYKSKSGGILDVLQDMKDKAEGQLSDLRQGEVKSKHSYDMLKQSLKDKTAADTKDFEEEKAARSSAKEGKATAEGDLERTKKELAQSTKELATVQRTCITVAADHQATVAARKEELEVLKKAEKVLKETTGEAVKDTYSFVQVQVESEASLTGGKLVSAVRRLAKQQHSAALAQLASRINVVLRSHRADPFSKVKGMIQDMIAKLEKQATEDATEKAYCDEQMSKTSAKQSDLQDDVSKMTSTIDSAAAKSTKLKESVRELEKELSLLAKEQAEMDKIRQDAHAEYVITKADLEQGLSGVRKALDVLREYYEGGSAAMVQDDESQFSAFMQQPSPPEKHGKSAGAGGSIIDILEVVESDFAKNLAKVETEESDSASEYEKMTQENKVTKATKEQDAKYQNQEIKALAKTIAEVSSDRETANTELAAVNEYFAKIKERCIAKPETYEQRAARRAAEIEGLKEAISILENEAASFVQRKHRGSFRGSLRA